MLAKFATLAQAATWKKATLLPGIQFLNEGIRYLLNHKDLWKYTWLPSLVSFLLVLPFFYFFSDTTSLLENKLIPDAIRITSFDTGESNFVFAFFILIWKGILWGIYKILQIFFFITSIFFYMVFYLTLMKMVSAPFNDKLSEHIEAKQNGRPFESGELPSIIESIKISAVSEFQRLMLFLIIFIPMFFISFIFQGIGQAIFSVLMTMYVCYWLSYDAMSYCMDRRKIGFRDRMSFLMQHPLHTFSFGFGAYVITLIPILNFFIMPVFASGGTLMYRKFEEP